MRVFGRRNTKQMCRSRSNSLVALIDKDNTTQPAASKRLCTPCLLFVLFTGIDCQRWSESIFNTLFSQKVLHLLLRNSLNFYKDLCSDSENMKKSNLHVKYLHEHYVFHSLRHFGHLSYIIIETCCNKTNEIFLDIMTINLLKFICLVINLFFWSFQTKI